MHGMYSKVVSDMARKARQTQNDNAFAFFRGAFTTSLTADGVAICGVHTTISGATVTNTHTGAGSALSSTTINTGITDLAQQLDQAGVIMGNYPSLLLVPTVLSKRAWELTQSALISDTSTNAVNVYRSIYGFTVWTSPFLDALAGGSDTAWFMLSPNHSVTRIVRQGITTALTDWSISRNRTYFYQANFRETVYSPDYAGITGFTGV